MGTGSGALASHWQPIDRRCTVYATDISPAALAVARENAGAPAVAVTFYEGDLLAPLIERGIKLDLIMANLPYIASGDLPGLAVSRYEPRSRSTAARTDST